MLRRVLILRTGLALLAFSLTGVGCQQSQPLRLTVLPDRPGASRFVENKDVAYINASFPEPGDPPEAFDRALSTTGSAFGTVFSPFVVATDVSVRWITNDRPGAADKMLEDRTNADIRREGMNKLADFGFLNNPLFTAQCRQIAARDADYTVRATAIRTANRARDIKATPLFIKGLADQNDWIRLEAAKALANVPDVSAAAPLVEMLNNPAENRDTRVAAADALKHYRTLPVARALSGVLSDRNFVIAWQARRSLQYLTDRDFGYDVAAWLAYFAG